MDYKQEKGEIIDHFSASLINSRDDHDAVNSSEISHIKRFSKILDLGDLRGAKVLDVGCAVGEFYGFLRARGVPCDYAGYDIVPAMIEKAKRKYPEVSSRFLVWDILEKDPDETFDYVVSVSPMNLTLSDGMNRALTIRLIKKMLSLCRLGMAISMTSSLTRKPGGQTFYYDPLDILREVLGFCQNVRFDHTYLPHDFTVFCYKADLYTF